MISCKQGKELYTLCRFERKVFVFPEDLGHNSDLLSNPEFLVRPMLDFFNLPDYNFDDLFVPTEAFDKRLSTNYCGPNDLPRHDCPSTQLRGDQDPCDRSCHTTFGSPCSPPVGKVDSDGDVEFEAVASPT